MIMFLLYFKQNLFEKLEFILNQKHPFLFIEIVVYVLHKNYSSNLISLFFKVQINSVQLYLHSGYYLNKISFHCFEQSLNVLTHTRDSFDQLC